MAAVDYRGCEVLAFTFDFSMNSSSILWFYLFYCEQNDYKSMLLYYILSHLLFYILGFNNFLSIQGKSFLLFLIFEFLFILPTLCQMKHEWIHIY